MTNSPSPAQSEEVMWLTRDEGIDLTIALGRCHDGDDYYNADAFGTVIHFGGTGFLASERARDPEVFAARVTEQIEAVQEIIDPYVGMYASAIHRYIGLKNGEVWELWKPIYPNLQHMHARGRIAGAAGIAFENGVVPHRNDLNKAVRSSWFGKVFKIGIVFDTSESTQDINRHVGIPNVDQAFVPVRGFPASKKYYNGIWSWQIRGKQ